jgi:hypothetical protein
LDVPQFGQSFQTTIDVYDSMLVPASKETRGIGLTDSQNFNHHWNCYGIAGPTLGQTIEILTQHGQSLDVILNPFLMCAPMIKDNSFFPDNGLDGEHMVCYNVDEVDRTNIDAIEPLPFALNDQVEGPVPFQINDVEKFCAPALKSFPTVGGSDVSINTAALLVAGAQSVSMWMIPVIVAGAGIGLFVIKRRN